MYCEGTDRRLPLILRKGEKQLWEQIWFQQQQATKGKDGEYYKSIITVYNGNGTLEYDAKSSNYHSVGDMVTITDYFGAYYIIS